MLPDRVSNPGPLTYKSGALSIALRGPAYGSEHIHLNYHQNSLPHKEQYRKPLFAQILLFLLYL